MKPKKARVNGDEIELECPRCAAEISVQRDGSVAAAVIDTDIEDISETIAKDDEPNNHEHDEIEEAKEVSGRFDFVDFFGGK